MGEVTCTNAKPIAGHMNEYMRLDRLQCIIHTFIQSHLYEFKLSKDKCIHL